LPEIGDISTKLIKTGLFFELNAHFSSLSRISPRLGDQGEGPHVDTTTQKANEERRCQQPPAAEGLPFRIPVEKGDTMG